MENKYKRQPEPMNTDCSRQKAEYVLQDKIDRLEREISALKILKDCIPWKILTTDDEERLWSYFIQYR